jgi:hypothetical protein
LGRIARNEQIQEIDSRETTAGFPEALVSATNRRTRAALGKWAGQNREQTRGGVTIEQKRERETECLNK